MLLSALPYQPFFYVCILSIFVFSSLSSLNGQAIINYGNNEKRVHARVANEENDSYFFLPRVITILLVHDLVSRINKFNGNKTQHLPEDMQRFLE